MKVLTANALLLAAGAAGRSTVHAAGCQVLNMTNAVVTAGREAEGFFVRVGPPEGRVDLPPDSQVSGAVDYLASQSSVTVVYLSSLTGRPVQGGEWRGATPLDALRAFAAACGLVVEVPSPAYWVVMGQRQREGAAVTLFVHTLDPARQRLSAFPGGVDLARSILGLLPVRDTEGFVADMALGVGYYWLPDEGPDSLLVLASTRQVEDPARCQLRVFKIRLHRGAPSLAAECLWESREVAGRLIPEIAEDFDHDGTRDFVFDSDGRDNAASVVLSGSDGRTLVSFDGNELAVEKEPRGAVRFAVQSLVGMEVDDGRGGSEEGGISGPLMLQASGGDGEFEIRDNDDLVPTAQSMAEPKLPFTAGPRRLLARALGSTSRVRVYLLQPGAALPGRGFDEVAQQRYRWELAPVSGSGANGDVSKILVRYESPGYGTKMLIRGAKAR